MIENKFYEQVTEEFNQIDLDHMYNLIESGQQIDYQKWFHFLELIFFTLKHFNEGDSLIPVVVTYINLVGDTKRRSNLTSLDYKYLVVLAEKTRVKSRINKQTSNLYI